MSDVSIALVTGANKGIGLEVARGLGAAGMIVYVGARQSGLGEAAAAQLCSEGIDARYVALDVTNADQVTAAAARIEAECSRVDVVVNNAAWGLDVTPPSQVTDAMMAKVFETNVIGPVRVIRAFLPLLQRSSAPRIVNVSSDFGSLTWNADPKMPHSHAIDLAYPASKSALNMVTVQFAKEFRGTDIKINSVNPGFAETDMTTSLGMKPPRTALDGARAILEFALAEGDGPTGGFFDENGPIPW